MRRIHVPFLELGDIDLPGPQAHHLRDVLRLEAGARVQAFDAAGQVSTATVIEANGRGVRIRVEAIQSAPTARLHLTVAAAVPKAARADWMIEKLSELGVDIFIPLQSARSVVMRHGQNKYDRWARLAIESAKQSARVGIMQIDPLTPLSKLLEQCSQSNATLTGNSIEIVYLSTLQSARSIFNIVQSLPPELIMLIGPEGGWTAEEVAKFEAASIEGIKLTETVLRVETAAIAATAILKAATCVHLPDSP